MAQNKDGRYNIDHELIHVIFYPSLFVAISLMLVAFLLLGCSTNRDFVLDTNTKVESSLPKPLPPAPSESGGG